MTKFCEKIKYIRKTSNLTQAEMATLLHTSRKTISGWENQRSIPDKVMVENISTTFLVSTEFLTNDKLQIHEIKRKSAKKMRYPLIINYILIVINYFKLVNIFHLSLSTVFLIINTVYIDRHIISNPPPKLISILLATINFSIGIIFLAKKLQFNNLNLEYIFSEFIFLTILATILTYSLVIGFNHRNILKRRDYYELDRNIKKCNR